MMNLNAQIASPTATGQDSGLDLFTCDICSQTFTSHLNLTVHKQSHEAENQYKCSYCNKMFSRRSYWRVHELGHSRPYRCELCNQSFTRQYNLTVHLRVHTGEKPYQCDECGQSFTRQYTLVLHKRMHSGEKPHECPVCGRRFSRMQTMRSHVKTHNSGHICTRCNLSFPNQQKLERHIFTHHKGDKPYICNVCGFRCSFSSSLQRHKQKHKAESQVHSQALPVVEKVTQHSEVMHPAQVTRLEQNIGFLRDQQEHIPNISKPNSSNADGDISSISLPHGSAPSLPHHEPSWMVLNDGRIINVESTSSGFPQIPPEPPGIGNQYFPQQDAPTTSLGIPCSQATSSISLSPSLSSENGKNDNNYTARKSENKMTSCARGKDIVITNVCSLTPTRDPQQVDSAIQRSDSRDSVDTDENNDSSENTQESGEDISSMKSSSLNQIEQMLQRQEDNEQSQMTESADNFGDSTLPRERTVKPAITGSQKRKASLLHGFFRDVSKERKDMEERNRKKSRQTNAGSELKKRLSSSSVGLRKSSGSEMMRSASAFDQQDVASRLASERGVLAENSDDTSVSETERVQTTDVSTSTTHGKNTDYEGARASYHSTARAGGAPCTEAQPNTPRSQSAVSTSCSPAVGCKSWRCHHCGVTFEDNVMFIIHMGCHGNQNAFQCNSCGMQCEGRVDFMLHFISGKHQG